MPAIRIAIVAYLDDGFPGFVECQVTDRSGRVWSFVEKVPLVTTEDLRPDTLYPRPGEIGCEVLGNGAGFVRICIDPLTDSIECEVPASALCG